MPGPKPPSISLTDALRQNLQTLVNRHTTPQQIALRGRIILLAAQGDNNSQIARKLGIQARLARFWRNRWRAWESLPLSEMPLATRLADAPRPGAPAKISAEAYCQIMVIACHPPENFGRPITQWTQWELAEEARKQGIVPRISPRQVGRFLKRSRP